ncbi:transcriptional regulator [Bacillus halotolerans]|uniref:transcriptional regulator n=1 Tax=Bacillus subtilis group TaxID=653685 RepID=UPI0020C54CE8|nr:transcriptional regulator [Bacillus subtilis]MCP6730621.1 transcriptional regulator [Bacillus subtilis]MEC1363052.1 transcriptional regulator [Bacillus subtilis]MEC1379699.1 transcriptional regulator [Bacillus subtilis]
MKLKKVLTGTALSLALLVSAAPAFAASPTDNHSEESQTKEVSALGTLVVRGLPSDPDPGQTITINGTTYYLDSVTFYPDGSYVAYYSS